MTRPEELGPAEELQDLDLDAMARRAGWIALGGLGLIALAVLSLGVAIGVNIDGGCA